MGGCFKSEFSREKMNPSSAILRQLCVQMPTGDMCKSTSRAVAPAEELSYTPLSVAEESSGAVKLQSQAEQGQTARLRVASGTLSLLNPLPFPSSDF